MAPAYCYSVQPDVPTRILLHATTRDEQDQGNQGRQLATSHEGPQQRHLVTSHKGPQQSRLLTKHTHSSRPNYRRAMDAQRAKR